MATYPKQFIFVGAQGTGKTTILNHYKERGWYCITEVVRQLAARGVKINEMGDIEGQKKIYRKYQELLDRETSYISDRGLIDVTAYTGYLCRGRKKNKTEAEELFVEQYKGCLEFLNKHKNAFVFYFPIEFDVVDDGVRSTDEKFRKEIDDNIKMILKNGDIPFIEVRGSVEERIALIDNFIEFLDKQ